MAFSEACFFCFIVQIVNAAIIVDPSVNKVIASASDQTYLYSSKTDSCNGDTSKHPETCKSNSDSGASLSPNGLHGKPKRQIAASCLNPWQWVQPKMHTTSVSWHPLHHAAIVAVESSAARDRHLFPSSGHDGDNSYEVETIPNASITTPLKKQKTDLTNVSTSLSACT